jgi:hypothetical protein
VQSQVEQAIEEIRASFPDSEIMVRDDGEGGAYVIVEAVELGPTYVPKKSWMGTRITFQYPYSDTYPHFVRGDLARADGGPLGEALSPTTFEGRSAIQVSRRSNHLDPRHDTAALKLQKVLLWLRSRS